jgi:RNA polymerase-binding transcription factor DksA
VGDRKDEAARRLACDIDEAEAQRDFDEPRLVQAALKRLEDGSYGDCLGCGESIPLARLQVQPAASLCAACQAQKERRPGPGQSARG